MSWNTVLVERLRYYIHDLDSSDYLFTDPQMEKFLAISAINVINDLTSFESTILGPYTVNTATSGSAMIDPDPVSTTGIPIGFSNLIVAKAACIISQAELRKSGAGIGGWKITDDRSTIDGTQSILSAAATAKTYCSYYTDALNEFKFGNRYAGSAVLSPYNLNYNIDKMGF